MTLSVRSLHKRMGSKQVLAGVGFTVDAGGLLAVIGPNGCGKTTLLRILAGVLEPDEGSVAILGEPLARARHHLGYVPEGADPPPQLTAGELERLVCALRRAPPLAADLRARLGTDVLAEQRIGSLSLGQRRRACLAAALVGAPWLLILDEPTNGLDAAGVDLLAGLLREQAADGRAAVIATHDLAFARAIGARDLRL